MRVLLCMSKFSKQTSQVNKHNYKRRFRDNGNNKTEIYILQEPQTWNHYTKKQEMQYIIDISTSKTNYSIVA